MFQILPADFGIPNTSQSILVLVCFLGLAAFIWKYEVEINDGIIMSLVPWMAFGASLRVLGVIGVGEGGPIDKISFLFGNPVVYLSTFIILGCVWAIILIMGRDQIAARILLFSGMFAFVFVMVILSREGLTHPVWGIAGLGISVVVSILVWEGIKIKNEEGSELLGSTGLLGVVGQVIDGISTAIGVDILNFSEQTPVSKIILDFGSSLPTANIIGGGWVFIFVKIVLAITLVFLFVDYVKEKPLSARIFLIVMISIGIGPGIHNLILYSVAG